MVGRPLGSALRSGLLGPGLPAARALLVLGLLGLAGAVGVVGTGAVAHAQQQRQGLDTTFDSLEEVAGQFVLRTGDGRSYRMTAAVHEANSRLWFFLKRGDRMHVELERGGVVAVSRGWKAQAAPDPGRFLAEVRRCQEGQRVRVDGREYLFLGASDTELRVAPRVELGFAGERTIALAEVRSFEVLDAGPAVDAAAPDELDVFRVQAGDTVELTVGGVTLVGVVAALGRQACELRVWRSGAYEPDPKLIPRREVTKVRHRALRAERRLALGPRGELTLTVSRVRRGAEGPLRLEVALSHDAPAAVIVGASLEFLLSERVGGLEEPDATMAVPLPALFPGDRHEVEHEAIHGRYTDGDVRVLRLVAVPYSDPAAKEPLIRAMDRAPDARTLGEFYRGAGRSGDAELVRLLLSRTVAPPRAAGIEAAEHASLARQGLWEADAAAVEAILNELETPDGSLGLLVAGPGGLARERLPAATEPAAHRRRLLSELADAPRGLTPAPARRLLELYGRRAELGRDIEGVFARQASPGLIRLLIDDAVPPAPSARAEGAGRAEGAERAESRERATQAMTLLRALGADATQHLLPALRARGLPAAELDEAWQRQAGAPPARQIEAALELARDDVRRHRRAALELEVTEAQAQLAAGAHSDALRVLRRVLEQEPTLASARALLPGLLRTVADGRRAAGRTGEAAELLEELEARDPSVRPLLAALYLAAFREDVEAVVLRSRAHPAASRLANARAGQAFDGAPAAPGWTQVTWEGSPAFVREGAAPRQGARYAALERTPEALLQEMAERIRALAPTLEAEVDAALGGHYAREADRLHRAGEYAGAMALYERAAALAPGHPLLSSRRWNWVKANAALLGGIGVLLLLGAGGFGLAWLRSRADRKEHVKASALEIVLFRDAMDIAPPSGAPDAGPPPASAPPAAGGAAAAPGAAAPPAGDTPAGDAPAKS